MKIALFKLFLDNFNKYLLAGFLNYILQTFYLKYGKFVYHHLGCT